MDIVQTIREAKLYFTSKYLSNIRGSFERYTTGENKDLNKIMENIKEANNFIVEEKDKLNELIDNYVKTRTRVSVSEITIAKQMVTNMETEMKKELKGMIDSQAMETEMKNELKGMIDSQAMEPKMKEELKGMIDSKAVSQAAGRKLYHRKRKSSRKKKSRRNIKSTQRKKRHSRKKHSKRRHSKKK